MPTFLQQVRCAQVICSRMEAHRVTGGILDGLKPIKTYPEWKNLGADDFPFLHAVDYTDKDEKFIAGAKTGDPERGNTNLQTTSYLSFILGVRRIHGLYNPSGNNTKPYGALEWITRIKDAIENLPPSGDAEPAPDATLEGTCKQPIYIDVQDSGVTDLGWFFTIRIRYLPSPTARGTRRDPAN